MIQKLEKSNVLKEDLAHYWRQEPGHPDHSYEYLINSMTRYLTRKWYDVNRAGGIYSILKNKGRGAAPAVDTDAKSKRAKAKAKRDAKAKKEAEAAKLAAHAGKGKGGGKGNGDKLGVCYFHNTDAGCTKTARECKFEHKKLSAAEAAKLVKPPGRESRANSPAAKAKAKSKAEPKSSPAPLATASNSFLLVHVTTLTVYSCTSRRMQSQILKGRRRLFASFRKRSRDPSSMGGSSLTPAIALTMVRIPNM